MHQYRRAGVAMQLAESPDVIDVRVSADDGLDFEFVAAD